MNTTSNFKIINVAMFLPSYEPLPMGGSELQAKKLAHELIKKDVNVIFITPGGNKKKYEIINGVRVFRFVTLQQKIANKLRKSKSLNISSSREEIIFDYSNHNNFDLQYQRNEVTFKWLITLADLLVSSFLLFFKLRKDFQILQINTINHIAIIGTVIGKMLKKKIIIKDSTMNGIIKMHMIPFPNLARRFLIKNCYFVAMTQQIEDNFIKVGIQKSKIVKIPNGIDTSQVISQTKINSFRCLFVGNLYQQPAKGIDILLKAWPIVLKYIPLAKLSVVGDGNINIYESYCKKELINESITFYGKTNPENFYKSHDIFILPSRREGMSNALMEAMLYGFPVVATNISGNTDLVENGVNGLIVPVNDFQKLAEAIIDILRNQELIQKCAIENPQKIQNQYSIEQVADSYINLYHDILVI